MRNKYNAKRTEVDGIVFASDREAKRYTELKLLERAGEIKGLELQPTWSLSCGGNPMLTATGRQIKYKADFLYRENGKTVVEDVKGFLTRDSMTRIAVVRAEFGIDVRVVK